MEDYPRELLLAHSPLHIRRLWMSDSTEGQFSNKYQVHSSSSSKYQIIIKYMANDHFWDSFLLERISVKYFFDPTGRLLSDQSTEDFLLLFSLSKRLVDVTPSRSFGTSF